MTDIKNELGNKSPELLKKYFDGLIRYEEEKKELSEKTKELLDEAKHAGFDNKTIKLLIKLSKQDKDKRQEERFLLETYADSLQLNLFD